MRKESSLIAAASSPFESFASIERAELLDAAGERCTPRQRVLLLLHYGQDVPFVEIARMFEVSESAIAHMHARALKELLDALLLLGIESIHQI